MVPTLRMRGLVAMVIVVAGSAAITGQTRTISPTYPTPAPNPTPQRFDPSAWMWRTLGTEHFDIFYTQQDDLDDIAREAERAYSRVSFTLKHQTALKVPLILVPTARDLPQDRQEATVLVRSSGAPDVDHLLLPVTPRETRATTLAHELTHIFCFELAGGRDVPRWASEGLADHMAAVWDAADLSRVRDAAAAGLIPTVASLTDTERVWGHALFDFVATEYGAHGIRQYLSALRSGPESAISRAGFGVTAADFDRAFRRYVTLLLLERSRRNSG